MAVGGGGGRTNPHRTEPIVVLPAEFCVNFHNTLWAFPTRPDCVRWMGLGTLRWGGGYEGGGLEHGASTHGSRPSGPTALVDAGGDSCGDNASHSTDAWRPGRRSACGGVTTHAHLPAMARIPCDAAVPGTRPKMSGNQISGHDTTKTHRLRGVRTVRARLRQLPRRRGGGGQ